MSISRLLHEFRPLFRILEDPLTRAPAAYHAGFPHHPFFADPFSISHNSIRPALDLTEEGNNYIVEAELPGVGKENIDITVGDGGRSVIIQSKTLSRRQNASPESTSDQTGTSRTEGAAVSSPNQLTSERLYSGTSSFMRTVWLPHPIDSSKVTAKLADGVLTLKAPKMEDKESIKIDID